MKIAPLFILLALAGWSCSHKISESVNYNNFPPDVTNYTLLVEKFEYRDPVVYDPFFDPSMDSTKKKAGFTYVSKVEGTEDAPTRTQHPLIVETNKHLDEYNEKLAKTFRKYNYKYELVTDSALKADPAYKANDKYHFILKHKPVVHCYEDPDHVTRLSYSYMYYFQDVRTGRLYPEVEVFGKSPFTAVKAIIHKINLPVKS
jgi:hypothetical protein